MLQVFHNDRFLEYHLNHASLNNTTMHRVALVDTADPEIAYQLTNNIDQSWIKNPSVYTSNLPETRSTSVGDMIVDGSPGDPGSKHIVIEPLGLRTLSREEICSITYHIQ